MKKYSTPLKARGLLLDINIRVPNACALTRVNPKSSQWLRMTKQPYLKVRAPPCSTLGSEPLRVDPGAIVFVCRTPREQVLPHPTPEVRTPSRPTLSTRFRFVRPRPWRFHLARWWFCAKAHNRGREPLAEGTVRHHAIMTNFLACVPLTSTPRCDPYLDLM